uniref:Uncharacterized protein n=1 Tax=Anguilla anguilla TaxID=7936 RepID=A0A0E9RZK1_ANGAN
MALPQGKFDGCEWWKCTKPLSDLSMLKLSLSVLIAVLEFRHVAGALFRPLSE